MINRREAIKAKGFSMAPSQDTPDVYIPSSAPIDYSKVKVGAQTLNDAVLNLGDLKKVNPRLTNKEAVLKAMHDGNIETMREISNFFYKTNGIYNRLCRYIAYLYKYDWMITPYVVDKEKVKEKALIADYNKALYFLDSFEVKRFFGDAALKVIKNGCYYGYLVGQNNNVIVQELPPEYCRSRYSVNGRRPAVEFNMKFFDDAFRDSIQRMKILNLFPAEFKKGYIAYKEGKLVPDYPGDSSGWYLLDTKSVIKFNLNGYDYPAFISVIPALIDLDAAQELDRKKMAQKLLKIIIQKMPLDKNGELIFDVDEAQALHNNAVRMIGRAIGIDILTTFADVEVADMADKNTTTSVDELSKIERQVFNAAGVSQMQFNTEGNIALEKSILNDEASMLNLVEQFESFLNDLLAPFNTKPNRLYYRAEILPTTIYNYKDLAKLYKEQVQLGYSKLLPQIALGLSQSSILANAYFENEILDLVNVFIPPMSSNTMNAQALASRNGGNGSSKAATSASESKSGRPEKPDDQKSEKTIMNKEAMS